MQPLIEMQDRHINMDDVRTRLGVKSIRCRIEKRVLERIGHVLGKGNDRITKAVVLGWWEKLEGREKKVRKKRKTVLYWKRLLREAGIEWTDIERIVGDRDGYRELVRKRVGHIEKWDRQKGHQHVRREGDESIGRSVSRDLDLVCRWEVCGKVCLSKGGLTTGRLTGVGVVGGLLGIEGNVRSATECNRQLTWRGTGSVVARTGTSKGDIGPDEAESRDEMSRIGIETRLKGGRN